MKIKTRICIKRRINNTLENVIKSNLITDTKIGTFSGGLDSSTVTAIAKKYNKIEDLQLFFYPRKIREI